jgi:hypothetical protein
MTAGFQEFWGCAMGQAVSYWSITAEAQVQSQASPDGICGAQSGSGTGFSLSSLVFPCHCYSTSTPYLHPFVYQQQCIILAHDCVVKMKHFCLSILPLTQELWHLC